MVFEKCLQNAYYAQDPVKYWKSEQDRQGHYLQGAKILAVKRSNNQVNRCIES